MIEVALKKVYKCGSKSERKYFFETIKEASQKVQAEISQIYASSQSFEWQMTVYFIDPPREPLLLGSFLGRGLF